MLAKLSLDQALIKAKSHANRGEIEEAQKIYQSVFQSFSEQAKDIKQGLSDLNKFSRITTTQDPPQEIINQLINLYKQGQFSLAVEQAQILTKQYPDNFMIWNILGASAAQVDMTDEAITAFKKVISIKPEYPDTYSNMGLVLQEQGKLDEAIEAYRKAISLKPDYAEAYNSLGNAYKDITKLDEAIQAYKHCIFLKPSFFNAYFNMGNIFQAQDKLDESINAYKKAIALKPDYAEAYNNIGNVLQDQGKLDDAIEAYKKAISIKPGYTDAYYNMGIAFKDQGKLDGAISSYKKAIKLNPNKAETFNNMGLALQDQGKLDQAIDAYKKSISLNLDYADAHKNLSFVLLNSYKMKEGLEEYEWRHKTKQGLIHYRHFPQPLWDGKTSLKDKTILLWCEQGIGDTMNWSSYLNLVTDCAKHVILECQEKLVPLLSRSFPNVEVKAEDRSLDADRDDFDLHLPIGSLYKHFVDEIMEKSNPNSYLVADPDRVKFWKDRLQSVGKGPYIGLSWKSPNMSSNRLQNYLQISDLYPILKMSNLTFINLQIKDYEDDIAQVQDELGITIHNFEDLDHFNNLLDVAALCGALDMVVSNKTTVPFISAGVGTPTKIANWRQSPWNNILLNPVGPSVKIFERNTWETWENTIKSIANDIKISNIRG